MSTALSEIQDDVSRIEGDALEQFDALALAIFADEKVEAAHVVNVLRAANKTKQHLADAVGLLETRRDLRNKITEIEQAKDRIVEVRRLIDEANAELERRVQEHQAKTGPLQLELSNLTHRMLSAGDPKQELFKTCSDPELRRQLETVMREQREKAKELHEARRSLHNAEESRHGHNYQHFADERQRIESWVTRAKAEIKRLEGESQELVEQNNTIMAAMRSW